MLTHWPTAWAYIKGFSEDVDSCETSLNLVDPISDMFWLAQGAQ